MTRELTGQEAMVMDKARKNYINIKNYPYPGYEVEGSEGFIAGFTAALEYAARLQAENEALRAALKVSLPVLETEYYLIDEETSPEYAKKVNLAYESARAALAKGGE